MSEAVVKAYSAARFSVIKTAGDQRRIKGVATTSRIDRDGEIMLSAGATFQLPISLLWQHDHSMPIGQVVAATATAAGIEIEAQLAPEGADPRIDEAWGLIKAGLVPGFSIGAIVKSSTVVDGIRVISQFEIVEVSAVTVPANYDALITEIKAFQGNTSMSKSLTPAQQIVAAVTKDRPEYEKPYMKSAIGAISTAAGTGGALVATNAVSRVIGPVITESLLAALVRLGAPEMPTGTRIVTQAAGLMATEVAEGAAIPAAAPGLAFSLTADRKFALILSFSNEMTALANFNGSVVAYMQTQLETAAANATDAFLVGLMTKGGTAAAGVSAGMSAFAGDLRTAAWIGHPATLAGLQDAANPNVTAVGGIYKGLPALPSYAAPTGKLFLADVARFAVFDGPQIIDRSTDASIVLVDGDLGNTTVQAVSMFQKSLVALRIVKYADASLLVAPQSISL